MSILVNILVAILGLTLVFGGLVGCLVKLFFSERKSVNNKNNIHTLKQSEIHRTSYDRRVS